MLVEPSLRPQGSLLAGRRHADKSEHGHDDVAREGLRVKITVANLSDLLREMLPDESPPSR